MCQSTQIKALEPMNLQEIKEKLEIITSNSPEIANAVSCMDNLLNNNDLNDNKCLVHYLEKRSYEKALMFLNGEKVEG